ncbi:hypothetical protein NW767_006313 [Fusarium falciforme]|nr:hypothetical protein NW767_006313 [Fusarium falciforme]
MTAFTVLVLDFLRRVFLKKSYLESRKIGPANRTDLPKAYSWLILAILISLFMIFVRSIYRTIELLQGWDGYLITHEGYFIGLDAATMTIAVAIFNFLDPVYLLWGHDDNLKPASEENELEQMQVYGERWDDSATVTDRE